MSSTDGPFNPTHKVLPAKLTVDVVGSLSCLQALPVKEERVVLWRGLEPPFMT